MKTLKQDIGEVAYEDVKKLIFKTVILFHRKCGGDFEEMLNDGFLAFAECLQTHDYNQACFSTWLVNSITYKLQDSLRKRLNDNSRFEPERQERLQYRNRGSDSLLNTIREVGEDAKCVLALTFDFSKVKDETPKGVKARLISFLKEMGWCTKRILESFQEIKEALR